MLITLVRDFTDLGSQQGRRRSRTRVIFLFVIEIVAAVTATTAFTTPAATLIAFLMQMKAMQSIQKEAGSNLFVQVFRCATKLVQSETFLPQSVEITVVKGTKIGQTRVANGRVRRENDIDCRRLLMSRSVHGCTKESFCWGRFCSLVVIRLVVACLAIWQIRRIVLLPYGQQRERALQLVRCRDKNQWRVQISVADTESRQMQADN